MKRHDIPDSRARTQRPAFHGGAETEQQTQIVRASKGLARVRFYGEEHEQDVLPLRRICPQRFFHRDEKSCL